MTDSRIATEAAIAAELNADLAAVAIADGRTPAERRGYPLPPWSEEARYPSGEEVLSWLVELLDEDRGEVRYDPEGPGYASVVAYLDAIVKARAEAQAAASRCAMEDHDGAVRYVVDARADALAVHGRVRELERTLAAQGEAYRALEELYVATHRPPVQLVTEVDEDDERHDVVTIRLAFDRLAAESVALSVEARRRIAEAASLRTYQAYEAELARPHLTVLDVTTFDDDAPRYVVTSTPADPSVPSFAEQARQRREVVIDAVVWGDELPGGVGDRGRC